MLFNSLEFLIFFPIVTIAYFMLPHAWRWFMLLTASCIFYMFFIPEYVLILLFTIVIDYISGIMIERAQSKRKLFLIISLCANIGVLAFFKYFNFLNGNVQAIANAIGWNYGVENLAFILPIGLSFHTFQAMSYVIEVYRGNQKAERHLGIYALYVMYYPQLVAGPIERPQNVLHQFHEKHSFDAVRVANGLKLMLWGMFKKVVIADRLAVYVNTVFDNPTGHQGWPILVAFVFFSFQIYCDFSGYSDIALGASRVMGIELMRNFNKPYFSQSISEFWRRWHISLSTWFKDYLYIPLGGNRVSRFRWNINQMIVFMVSGLWHGANWTFIFWGGLHGLWLITGRMLKPVYNFLGKMTGIREGSTVATIIATAYTFLLVTFAWIFFRANTFGQAFELIKRSTNLNVKLSKVLVRGITITELATSLVLILLLLSIEFFKRNGTVLELVNAQSRPRRYLAYHVLFAALLFYGVYSKQQFIYFQF